MQLTAFAATPYLVLRAGIEPALTLSFNQVLYRLSYLSTLFLYPPAEGIKSQQTSQAPLLKNVSFIALRLLNPPLVEVRQLPMTGIKILPTHLSTYITLVKTLSMCTTLQVA